MKGEEKGGGEEEEEEEEEEEGTSPVLSYSAATGTISSRANFLAVA